MKVVLKTMLMVLVVYMGFNFFMSSKVGRKQDLYRDALQEFKSSQDGDYNVAHYIDKTMVGSDIDQYVTKPVYSLSINDEDYQFNFEVYHFKKTEGKVTEQGLKFYVYDFSPKNYKGKVANYEAYEKDRSLAALEVRINTDNVLVNRNLKLGLHEDGLLKNYIQTDDLFDNAIYLKNDKFYFKDGVREIEFNKLMNLEFYILDRTDSDKKVPSYIKIGELTSKSSKQFFTKEVITTTKTSNIPTFEVDLFESEASGYKVLSDLYATPSNITNSDFTILRKYDGRVTRTVILWSILAIIIGFMLFLWAPVKQMILVKKQAKK